MNKPLSTLLSEMGCAFFFGLIVLGPILILWLFIAGF